MESVLVKVLNVMGTGIAQTDPTKHTVNVLQGSSNVRRRGNVSAQDWCVMAVRIVKTLAMRRIVVSFQH